MAKPSANSALAQRMKDRMRRNQTTGPKYIKVPPGMNMFKPVKGKQRFSILPYTVTMEKHPDGIQPGEQWFAIKYKVHVNVGPSQDQVICPRSMGKRCPICEDRDRRLKAGEPKENTDELRPRDRELYCVRNETEKDYEIQLFEYSYHLFGKLLEVEIASLAEDSDYGDDAWGFWYPGKDGFSLDVRWTERSFGNGRPFCEADRVDLRERAKAVTDKDLDKVPDLDDLLDVLPYDDLAKMYLELGDDDESNEDDDKPRRGRGRREESKDDDGDDGDNEPAPTRRGRREEPKDDEPAPRRGRREEPKDDGDGDDDAPPRRGRREEPKEDEPAPTRRGRREEPKDDGDDAPPKRGRREESKGGEFQCPNDFGPEDHQQEACCEDCPEDIWTKCAELSAAMKPKSGRGRGRG